MANYLTIIHECKDYPTWKKAYDSDAPNRAAAGLTDIHLLREHDNVVNASETWQDSTRDF